jgi:hypothetical protein
MKNLLNGLKKLIDGFRFGATYNTSTGQTTVDYPSPKPQFSPAPPVNPSQQYAQAEPTPQQQYGGGGFRVQVPSDNGPVNLPDSISQNLGNELDRYGLATEAARVLIHPRQQTYTPQEVAQYGHENWNTGENPQFITTNTDRTQGNGTIDRGLMRENSQPFKELQGSHKWNTILKENGIKSFDDLHDTAKSIRYAKILGDYYEQDLGLPRWLAWFAAPPDLRTRESSLANK